MTPQTFRGVRSVMRGSKIIVFLLSAMTLPLTAAFAGGAGGVAWSDQYDIQGLSNSSFSLSEVGGLGYGVDSRGRRTGGFGFALFSPQGSSSLAGGVGGFILGRETRRGPLCLAANLWAGLGGVSANLVGAQTGFAVMFAEVSLELGIAPRRGCSFPPMLACRGLPISARIRA